MLKAIVDRFESNYAIIEFFYGNELVFIDVIRTMLPFGTAPGDPLIICKAGICDVEESKEPSYYLPLLKDLKEREGRGYEFNLDAKEKQIRHKRIKDLANELFKD